MATEYPANNSDADKQTVNKVLDKGGEVREGEELDAQAVSNWLREQGVNIEGEPTVTQFSGGASNWTYRLQYNGQGTDQDLILRRPPKGTKAKSAHDMVREYTVQKALKDAYPYVPKMVALCTDESVIGADFYVMERMEGIIPRANLPKGIDLDVKQTRVLCTNVIDALIDLHQVDYKKHPDLVNLGRGEGYCERQVTGWDKRYVKAKTPNVPSFGLVRQWLGKHTPADSKTCLIHNDWRFDNVILDATDPTKVIGVLDWEMATLGDPLMDLGSALAYWVEEDDNIIMQQSRRQPTHLEGMMTRDEVVDYYLQQTGLKIENWTFYEVFGLFRLAGIVQQIYYRYYNKQTTNPAFKNFWLIVHVLHAKCLKLIAQYEGEALFNTYVQPQLKEIGIDAATIEQLPAPVQKVVKGILPKGYFAKPSPSSDE
ncbi:aminoglycoside phosphotransferase (APT) family kinase protein [Psychrobacter luti]|uniref:Aminoglycoside phosphotransferase (APT) family kinase protein n=1 Tax=Psychrobacter luti TaxID=198481 RepID=A0A839TC98_9GAMM|nr:phosphotransferase family protein [Psychrobacter luti]MBB3105724.1 aminoglycoside phosphotransferase (APT) family kinase protein [Psychrobacter luti]